MRLTTHAKAVPAGIAFVLLAAGTAFAVDGVIEINEARGFAGGVTTGDDPGFPVEINASGSYRLTGNLAPSGNQLTKMIEINAGNVTVNLGGFEIRCGIVCPPGVIGIDATDQSNVTVLDGTVRNMTGTGVIVGPNGRVESMRVLSNGLDGIRVTAADSSTGSTLIGNTVAGNGGCGLRLNSQFYAAYGQNVIVNNNGLVTFRQVSGGTPMGANVCSNGADCDAGPVNNCP